MWWDKFVMSSNDFTPHLVLYWDLGTSVQFFTPAHTYLTEKKVVRLIFFSIARAHTAPLCQHLGIRNIHKQCHFNTCTFIFDLKNSHFSHSVYNYLDPVPHNYPTRINTGDNFYIPKVHLTLSQHNLKYAATKLWNSLPVCLTKITERTQFKRQLKDWLLNCWNVRLLNYETIK